MNLWAISDVHVGHADNRELLARLPACPGDWLILAGDVGETQEHLQRTIDVLGPKFERLVWVPGNHDLWTVDKAGEGLRGQDKYLSLVELGRRCGVLTPEDPYEPFPGNGAEVLLVPMFLLYDYSFAPPGYSPVQALAWAEEAGLVCADEHLLYPDPFPSRQAWCQQRLAYTEERLERERQGRPTVLINHFPLHPETAHTPRIPRFRIWCGTERTRDWHQRFDAQVVVTGHLHMPSTRFVDEVRFEEVSLGYPRERAHRPPRRSYLRQIWPDPGYDRGQVLRW